MPRRPEAIAIEEVAALFEAEPIPGEVGVLRGAVILPGTSGNKIPTSPNSIYRSAINHGPVE